MTGTTDTAATTVVTVDPVRDPLWTTLLDRHRSDVFHSPGWLRTLTDTYGFPVEARVLVDRSGTPLAGFVYAPVADLMDPRVVSLPFSDFCDPLVDDGSQWIAVTDGLFDQNPRIHMRSLHSEVPRVDGRLTSMGRARWHSIDVGRTLEEIWDGIHPSARRSIRKATGNGVRVRAGEDIADLRLFFELHLAVRKHKYQLLAQPWRFFENLWDNLLSQGAGALLLAERDGTVLGGVVFVEWNDTLYYKFNASEADHLGVRPNDLVIWEGIQHAQRSGLSVLDFGASDWDHEGLIRFKRKYATDERTIHQLGRMPPDGSSNREAEVRALLSRITHLMTRSDVTDEISEQAGDLLYRYFV